MFTHMYKHLFYVLIGAGVIVLGYKTLSALTNIAVANGLSWVAITGVLVFALHSIGQGITRKLARVLFTPIHINKLVAIVRHKVNRIKTLRAERNVGAKIQRSRHSNERPEIMDAVIEER